MAGTLRLSSPMDLDLHAEALRQQELLAALAAPRAPADASPGLRAYRTNAHASAERALATACPTLAALLGPEDFAALAREFWHAHPPLRGDLGEWGEALPDWIAGHAGLADWPYLADCARLDLALHRCERAADAQPDSASLALLASEDPARLRLKLMPGVALLVCAWPVASIHAAHAPGAGGEAFRTVRARLRDRVGESVVVARSRWRGLVHPIDAAGAAFTGALLEGERLAPALDRAGERLDFGAWLADAVRLHWLQGLERARD